MRPPSAVVALLHDIHADAASGQSGQLFGRGEARLEDEAGQPALIGVLVGAEQAPFDRARADAVERKTAAIVGQFDHDFIGLLRQ
jgi:hypothetical protein